MPTTDATSEFLKAPRARGFPELAISAGRVSTKMGGHGKTKGTGPLEATMPIPRALHSFAPTMLRRLVRNHRQYRASVCCDWDDTNSVFTSRSEKSSSASARFG